LDNVLLFVNDIHHLLLKICCIILWIDPSGKLPVVLRLMLYRIQTR